MRANVKVATTLRAPLIVTLQVDAVPVQSPPHPVNTESAPGVAVSCTGLPATKALDVQVVPQSMPGGELRTVPPPVPRVLTASVADEPLKFADTVRDVLIETVQVSAVPLQSPPHPAKTEPAAGVAVSVTDVPTGKALDEQVTPQSMPVVSLRTRPLPVPERVTSSVGADTKVALTLRAALMLRVHVGSRPAQSPDQPLKKAPGPGVAVKVTGVPAA
jgi:hypothetical protein